MPCGNVRRRAFLHPLRQPTGRAEAHRTGAAAVRARSGSIRDGAARDGAVARAARRARAAAPERRCCRTGRRAPAAPERGRGGAAVRRAAAPERRRSAAARAVRRAAARAPRRHSCATARAPRCRRRGRARPPDGHLAERDRRKLRRALTRATERPRIPKETGDHG